MCVSACVELLSCTELNVHVLTKQVYYLLMFDGQFLPYMEVLNNYPDGCGHVCVHVYCMYVAFSLCV